MKTLKDLKERLMKNEKFRKEYYRKKPLVEFVNELIKLRSQKGITQEELAKMIGTKKSNISRIENAKQNISYEMMVRLVEALGGQLLITAHGDSTLKLSKKVMEKLKKLSKRLGKTPSEVVEEFVENYELIDISTK